MGELLKLLTRFVAAVESVAESLGELAARPSGTTTASATGEPIVQDEGQAEEQDPDDLGGGDAEPEPELTLDDVRKAVRAYAAKNGEPKAVALMKKVAKAGKISEIKPEHFAKVVEACEA